MTVHLVTSHGVTQIVNLSPPRSHILNFFSPACQRYYLLLVPVPHSKSRTKPPLDFCKSPAKRGFYKKSSGGFVQDLL